MFLEEFENKGDAGGGGGDRQGGRATSRLPHSSSLLGHASAWRDSTCWGVWGRDIGSIPSSGPRSERRAGPRAHLTPLFLPMLSSRGRPFCPTPAPVWTRHADAPRRVGEKGESLGSLPSPSAFISRVECSPARPGPTPPKAGAVLPAQRALRGRRVHVPCPCSPGCVSSRPQPPRLARSTSSETAFSVSRGGPHALSPGPSGGPD